MSNSKNDITKNIFNQSVKDSACNIIWSANSIVIDGKVIKHPDITGISFDTRTLKAGDMFFALKGERDGHNFVKQAIEKGASCAVVEHEVCENNIVVNSVLNTLVQIAQQRRAMFKGVVIGITGSVGKTTSKQMLARSLQLAGKKIFATEKSYNNLLGLAYSLAQLPLDAEFAILELGTSNPGEIEQLSKLCCIDYSLVTAVAPAHIISFGTLKNIAIEKGQILKFASKGCVFDCNAWYSNLFKNIAQENDIPFRCFESCDDAMTSLHSAWRVLLEWLDVTVQFDDLLLNNIAGRRDVFKASLNGKQVQIIDSAYNANLSSMIESLKFLHKFDGPKTAILGDMLCIGDRSRRYHEMLACYLNDIELLCVGDHMRLLSEKKNGVWFENIPSLLEHLKTLQLDGTILIKGSSDGHKSSNDLACVVEFFKSLSA